MPRIPLNDAFEKIFELAKEDNTFTVRTAASYKWYERHIKGLRLEFDKQTLLTDKIRQKNSVEIGKMYTYLYKPKLHKTLPYYDIFPLVFPIEKHTDGFLAINLHYLPPNLRALLMDKLYDLANKEVDESGGIETGTKLTISYEILKSFNKYKLSRVCFRKYLYSNVRTKFTIINPNEWDAAIFLPSEKFQNETKENVWSETRAKLKRI